MNNEKKIYEQVRAEVLNVDSKVFMQGSNEYKDEDAMDWETGGYSLSYKL